MGKFRRYIATTRLLIAVPEQSHDTHLKVLQQLSKNLMHDDKRQRLLDTTNEAELYETLQRIIKA